MCVCVRDIENKAKETFSDGRFKRAVLSVRMDGVVFPIHHNDVGMKTSNQLEVTLSGQKKRPTVTMMHSYCPFCGEKYGV